MASWKRAAASAAIRWPPPKTTIREHLHLTAPDDCMHFYGVEAPLKYDIGGTPDSPFGLD